MENLYNNVDIYYQINSYEDIQEYKLKNIKNNPYFLIESKINPKKITFSFIENLLINDGVDLSIINEFKYLIEEKKNDKIKILLKPLSDNNISDIKYLDKIYLHLLMEEEQETPQEQIINEEMDEYNTNVEKYEKYFDEISMGIKKEEIYNQKILSDNLFKNIEKNNFPKAINKEFKNTKTTIKNTRKTFMPSLINTFSGINEEELNTEINNDNFSDNDSDIDIENNLKINENQNRISNDLLLKKRNTLEINIKNKDKEGITLCYLYSNPLLYKDNIKKEYINNDCFNEIVSIYNIFKESNIQANLKFEPIINNPNTYLESTPDILHINVNSSSSSSKKKINLNIDLDYLGELQYYKCEDLKKQLGQLKMDYHKLNY